MRLSETADGVCVEAEAYRLTIFDDRPYAALADADGQPWGELALLASFDTCQGLDDTTAYTARRFLVGESGWCLELEATSNRWRSKTISLTGDEATIRLTARVEGDGELTEVRLLGGSWSGDPRAGTGEATSRAAFRTVFTPEPADPARVCRPAAEPAQLDVFGDGRMPGRGHWFFTPPPFCLAFSRSEPIPGAAAVPAGPWLTLGLAAPIEAQTFTTFRYEPGERSFEVSLGYEGMTRVGGSFEAPLLVLRPGATDPYEGIAGYAANLRAAGLAPVPDRGPRWWAEPIFCGWGEQSRLAEQFGVAASSLARQELYERWLDRLAARGLRPGTIAVDDRWQASYGTSEPDPERWPDMRGWIARRHAEGLRVLLWWKAWDPDGLPAELCVRNAAGVPVAADPTNPAYEALLRAQIRRLLGPGPDGFDADGLKIDFTARTPSGPGMRRHGTAWGVALLHRLLEILATEARAVKPDALIVTHAPNPAFADTTGMLRLNDMQRLDEPDDPAAILPQMLHRARVARAACPGLLLDTDDWCPPGIEAWRAYLQRKPSIGVPALYYVDGLDRTGEDFDEADYAALRRVWAEWRAAADREPMNEPDDGRRLVAAGAHAEPAR